MSPKGLNEIHSQLFDELQEYPFEANDVNLSLDKVGGCLYIHVGKLLR